MKPASREILILLYFEIEYSQQRGKKRESVIINRDNIILSYGEITDRLGYRDKAIWTAFKEFHERGFIETVKRGGGAKNDYSVYSISEKWRRWKPGEVIKEKAINGKTGWQREKNKQSTGKRTTQSAGKRTQTKKGAGSFPQGKPLLEESLRNGDSLP
jgi:hypothetical protein